MKTSHKHHIRALILDLLNPEDLRLHVSNRLNAVKADYGEAIDEFEAMNFYEREVERINKTFCYPQQALEDSNTNHLQEVTP